jgi:hypothetical protein
MLVGRRFPLLETIVSLSSQFRDICKKAINPHRLVMTLEETMTSFMAIPHHVCDETIFKNPPELRENVRTMKNRDARSQFRLLHLHGHPRVTRDCQVLRRMSTEYD